MTPIIMPIFDMSLVVTSPVECARALGGVDIGNSIANEVHNVAPTISILIPPTGSRASPIPTPTALRIGTIRLAAAVFEMKLEMK